jgi:hypothetical protein
MPKYVLTPVAANVPETCPVSTLIGSPGIVFVTCACAAVSMATPSAVLLATRTVFPRTRKSPLMIQPPAITCRSASVWHLRHVADDVTVQSP